MEERAVSSLIDQCLSGFLIQPRTTSSWNGAINSVLDPPISVNNQDNISDMSKGQPDLGKPLLRILSEVPSGCAKLTIKTKTLLLSCSH